MYSAIERVDSETQNFQEVNMAFKDEVRCISISIEKRIQQAKNLWHNFASISSNLRTQMFHSCLAIWVLQSRNLKVQQ